MPWKNILLVLLAAMVAACATQSSVASAGSIVKDFDAPYGSVTAATRHSIETLNVTITSTEQIDDVLTIQFKKPMSAWSWGELGWTKVYPSSSSGGVTVEVASQKVLRTQITGTGQDEFAAAIFEGIENALADLATK